MTLKVYSIFDTKVEAYGVPFFLPNDEAAKRAVMDAATAKNTTLNRHPKDFELWHLCDFNDAEGNFFDPLSGVGASCVCAVVDLVPSSVGGLFDDEQELDSVVAPLREPKEASNG